MRRSDGSKPAVVLFLVLAVLAAASLIALGVLARTGTRLDAVAFDAQRVHLRAALRSGVHAVMAQLQAQRDALMDGGDPELVAQWSISLGAVAGEREAQISLLEFAEGRLAASEAARVDVNSADVGALEKFLPAAAAGAIVDARSRGAITSPERLIGLPGLHADDALGREAQSGADRPQVVSSVGALEGGLLERLGVFAADPNLRTGLGQSGSTSRGEPKIDLSSLTPEQASEELDRALRSGVGERWKQRAQQGKPVSSLADVVAALIELGEEPGQWGAWLDAVCATPDPFVTGRIDLNRAPAEVLATLPGLEPAQARSIVESRASLDAQTRRSAAWPVTQGIVRPEQFAAIADRVTTRSLQWRVRVRASLARPRPAFADASAAEPAQLSAEAEAVIDVSGDRPRLAYLREITLADVASTLAQRDDAAAGPEASEGEPGFEPLRFRELQMGQLEMGQLRPRELNIRGSIEPSSPKPDTLEGDGAGQADEAVSSGADSPPARSASDRRVGRWSPLPPR